MNFERDVRKLRRLLSSRGFTLAGSSGSQSHEKWEKGDLSVSIPRTKEIKSEKTLRSIYKQAGWL